MAWMIDARINHPGHFASLICCILVQCVMLSLISITVKRNHEWLIYVDRDDEQKQLYKMLTVMGK